jgi:anti-sigma factor RsiW
MNPEQELKLQAYLDGELSDREARQISDWLAKDAAARSLFEELQMMKTVLTQNEPELKLPESREFFWSKIQRDIRVQEQEPARASESVSIFAWLHRHLLPVAGAAAALALIVGISLKSQPAVASQLAESESLMDDMGLMTFRSQADQLTVVWVYDKDNSSVADTASDATLDPQ